jgi:hypothetical protein
MKTRNRRLRIFVSEDAQYLDSTVHWKNFRPNSISFWLILAKGERVDSKAKRSAAE